MGIFDFLKAQPYRDPQLGILQRSRGYWRGLISLASHADVPLLLSGGRAGPDQAGAVLARELPDRFPALIPSIQEALFEHYLPYREAVEADEIEGPVDPCPRIAEPAGVWELAVPKRVVIAPLKGVPTIEIAYGVRWDTEHTLAARIQAWKLIEMCGSIRDAPRASWR